jgi:transposase-like protein
MEEPQTLVEAVRYFADEEATFAEAKAMRWPDGVVCCPTCGRTDVRFIATRKLWECKEKHSRKQFSVKVGTIFEDSALSLDKWFIAIWAIANCKNGISSYELARMLGITQKSAWHMLHRIRLAMKLGSFAKFDGRVESDETHVGGAARNMSLSKRAQHSRALHHDRKGVVWGLIERTTALKPSRVHAKVVKDASAKVLQAEVRANVEPGANLLTDEWTAYKALGREYLHETVHHAAFEYVRDHVHTNGIENFWSLLKRTVKGTYVSVEPVHLQAYVDEQVFRFNERKGTDRSRFLSLAKSIVGKRLTYKELVAHGHEAAA